MNNDFDFWIGSWVVTDPSDGSSGRNTIRRILGGKVLEESFTFPGPDGKPYRGRSHTVHVDGRGWCQTWVDSTGLYLDFAGHLTDGVMRLERRATVAGKTVVQRMEWSDITPDSLVWQWMRAPERTSEFELLWRLDYRRSA
ncbi:MAG: hypothetical protein QOI82_3286 [Actinomycetota bacterium]|nr:hypothetical protein [Actinomycetota bacterium]